MSQLSIAEAGERLSDLIDRAAAGEKVSITRDGEAVAELRPTVVAARPRPAALDLTDPFGLEWLRARRIKLRPGAPDAGTLLSQMRDEDWR